jgi:hypothetical protein
MNNVSFVPPTTPVLLQILSGAEDAQSLLPTGSVFPIPKDSVIQVSIPGGGQVRGVLMPRHRDSELMFFLSCFFHRAVASIPLARSCIRRRAQREQLGL